ncbi:aminodeoxychorismate lyase [Alphaproteobacteria bacterium]|nr:aminodeoxychorismate lyase [Alphaproteobacteria bacterium]
MRAPKQSRFGAWLAVALTSVAAFGLAGSAWRAFNAEGPLPVQSSVMIRRGADLDDISRFLQQRGIIGDASLFRLGARVLGKTRSLRAGEFAIPARASQRAVLDILANGQAVVRRVQAIEGLTSYEFMDIMAACEGLEHDTDEVPPNGSLMPDTYYYAWGDRRSSLIARMKLEMKRYLDHAWEHRAPGLPFNSPQEAVVLASIVERETPIPAERPRVASVFVNRLTTGMRLQSDPTVIFALTGRSRMGRALTYDDLRVAHPYNTYTSDGLPPEPICNPSRASIEAVLHPDKTEFLYFVANGDGGHNFTRTYAEHLKQVAGWRKVQGKKR